MAEINPNARLEAFCDGVFAIAITLLIIDIKIPATTEISSTAALWKALAAIAPNLSAFVLSFIIIFITWVNHHASLKLGNRSSPAFIYANGLLMLTVVFLPFPTVLMGEYILTNHSSPAVILYNTTLAFQAIGWILLGKTSLKDKLYKNEEAAAIVIKNRKFGYFAFSLYATFAFLAIWFPITIAILTILSWIFWMIWGINIKHDQV